MGDWRLHTKQRIHTTYCKLTQTYECFGDDDKIKSYTQTQSPYALSFSCTQSLGQQYPKVYPPTSSECPTHSLTPQGLICRHNKVISGVPLDLLREGDGGHSTLGSGGITVDEVGVIWISTIVNGAGVPWLKHALHVSTCWVG